MLCVLSLKLLSLWLAAEALLEGWGTLAASMAGSGAGGVGHGSSPISHLSRTMRALLDASPAQAAYSSYSELGGGVGRRGEDWRSQGKTWEILRSADAWILSHPGTLLPAYSYPLPHFINLSLYLETKKKKIIIPTAAPLGIAFYYIRRGLLDNRFPVMVRTAGSREAE